MDNAQGAVSPYQGALVQGDVITPSPSQIVNPRSVATHKFLQVLKDVIRKSGIYTAEDDLLRALDDITTFGKHLISPADHVRVIRETDIAPVEDVRLRRPPQGIVTPASSGYQTPIDYRFLAEMIVQVQKEQALEAVAAAQAAAEAAAAQPAVQAAPAPVLQVTAQPATQPALPAAPADGVHVITDAKPSNGTPLPSTLLDDIFSGQ